MVCAVSDMFVLTAEFDEYSVHTCDSYVDEDLAKTFRLHLLALPVAWPMQICRRVLCCDWLKRLSRHGILAGGIHTTESLM